MNTVIGIILILAAIVVDIVGVTALKRSGGKGFKPMAVLFAGQTLLAFGIIVIFVLPH